MKTKRLQYFLWIMLITLLLSSSLSLKAEGEAGQTSPTITLTGEQDETGIMLSWSSDFLFENVTLYQKINGTEIWMDDDLSSNQSYHINDSELIYGTDMEFYLEAVVLEEDEENVYSYRITSNSVSFYYDLTIPTITSLKANTNSLTVKFDKVQNAWGYNLIIYQTGTKEQVDSKEIWADSYTGEVEFNYEYSDLIRGNKYDIYIEAYRGNDYNDNYYTKEAPKKSIAIPFQVISNLKVTNPSETTNQLTWSKMSNVSGYEIRYSTTKKGTYKVLKRVSKTTTKYIHTKLKLGTTYYYQVYAYNANTKSISSSTVGKQVTLQKVAGLKITLSKATQMKITWKKQTYATGYYIYRSISSNNWNTPSYSTKPYRTVKQSSNPYLTVSVTNGKYYSYKIIPYKTINKSNLKGNSSEKARYANYYGYENEDFDSRWTRIYGTSGDWYRASSVAKKNMTTIKVKVWDFKTGMSGKKITETMYLTVNKKIAPTVKLIFEEIYKGKEKAPIYSVGGYSWRSNNSSEHTQGLAIDLNPKYNYFINNNTKKILSGSYWNPSKYAYSIKRNGDIEKAFAKYGFSRGFWSSTSDYMHFSYLGT